MSDDGVLVTQFSSCSLLFFFFGLFTPYTFCKAPHTEPTVAGPEFITREEGGEVKEGGTEVGGLGD